MSDVRAHVQDRGLTYPEQLDQAWRAAKAPRKRNAPTVVSAFAGCGGSSLGYAMAGYRELLAIEFDDNAVATLRANFPGLDVFHGDIAKLTGEEVLKRTGLKPGELDVFDGSPPCQGFSTAGSRRFADPRNSLFREYVRLLKALKPRAFVMENVSGMVKGKMKLIFAMILRELKACGYTVVCRLLNTKWFGVPQSRQRVIFLGVRKDLGVTPVFPKAQTRPVTVAEALVGVNDPGPGIKSGRGLDLWRITRPGAQFSEMDPKGHYFNAVKVDPHQPAPTILKMCIESGCAGLFHWSEPRILGIGEIKRLASFPDPFEFVGTFRERWARIGNCVPPLVMSAIAKSINRHSQRLPWREKIS